MAGLPGIAPGAPGSGEGGPPAARDEISESIAQALRAAQAQTAAAAAKATSSDSAPGAGSSSGDAHQPLAGGTVGVAASGAWSRMSNRISAEQHRENGSRAPKRYRKQVDDYFRNIARESAKGRTKP